jgi:hypothetical protein
MYCNKYEWHRINPDIRHTCPTGYQLRTINNQQCKPTGAAVTSANISTIVIPSTPIYSCRTGYTLNTADKKCYQTAKIKTTPATPSYICPSGYTLNSTANTCTPVVAIKNNTVASTSTANVWDGLENWIGWVLWIAK